MELTELPTHVKGAWRATASRWFVHSPLLLCLPEPLFIYCFAALLPVQGTPPTSNPTMAAFCQFHILGTGSFFCFPLILLPLCPFVHIKYILPQLLLFLLLSFFSSSCFKTLATPNISQLFPRDKILPRVRFHLTYYISHSRIAVCAPHSMTLGTLS